MPSKAPLEMSGASPLDTYYAKKLDAHLNKLWNEGVLDQKRLDEINGMDLHQWLREQKEKDNLAV